MNSPKTEYNKFRNKKIEDVNDFRIGCYYFIEEKSYAGEIEEIMKITELVEEDWGAKTIHDFTNATLESEWNHDSNIFDVFNIYWVDMKNFPELLL